MPVSGDGCFAGRHDACRAVFSSKRQDVGWVRYEYRMGYMHDIGRVVDGTLGRRGVGRG